MSEPRTEIKRESGINRQTKEEGMQVERAKQRKRERECVQGSGGILTHSFTHLSINLRFHI